MTGSEQASREHELRLAAYDQNSQNFRSLNQLMWQIPLIAMTLTGGLWFGVSRPEADPVLQLLLLGFACVGNLGLVAILFRLRFLMEQYLVWLRNFDGALHVDGQGTTFFTRSFLVRRIFQLLMFLAAICSAALAIQPFQKVFMSRSGSEGAVAFYDRYAEDLVDAYEALPFEDAHSELAAWLIKNPKLRILDIGAGSGRDAAWMAAKGHVVTAIEPSDRMRDLARQLHRDVPVQWAKDNLPQLETLNPAKDRFDVILLSAVWMHVEPTDRREALERLSTLLAPDGRIFMTLRFGSSDRRRPMHEQSVQDLRTLARQNGLVLEDKGEMPDLLGRQGVSWRTVQMMRPAS